jgi:DNA-binding Lrp family transcriptional regulator
MVTAFVLINIEGKSVRETAKSLIAIDGVTEVYPIAGEFDFVAVVRVKDNVALSRIITDEIIHKKGVLTTKTLFALDVYSKIDLQSVYNL